MDVFISYETTTGLQIAKHLRNSLAKLGVTAFVAEEAIAIGDEWEKKIDTAISGCKYFMLIITNLALVSEQVRKEVDRASSLSKRTILCRKANVSEKAIAATFPILAALQRIDFENEFELADAVTSTILEKELDLRYSFELSAHYQDLQKIAEGGFSTIYKAKRRADGVMVAISVIHRLDETTRNVLLKSLSVWVDLKHTNIAEVYSIRISPFFYLEMEFCEASLADCRFPLPIGEALTYVTGLCRGLGYAHERKVVHGDLKPANILVKDNTPKISDWGLSKNTMNAVSTIISPGFTMAYAAPEQISFSAVDARTDLYQVGIVFYEMMTGLNPILGWHSSPDETMILPASIGPLFKTRFHRDMVPPSSINSEAKIVDSVIMRLLEPRKENRYQSAKDLEEDIKAIIKANS